MITIWKEIETGFELIEEIEEGALTVRLAELRADGNNYRAEKRDGTISSILEV
jgi:hypothetical protein